jgi:threonine dehydratase
MDDLFLLSREVKQAAVRIEKLVHRTTVVTSSYFDRVSLAECFFKCENLQKVGAFKFRGACNAVFSASDREIQHGVVAHSSGNHAQALALAAHLRGIRAFIVMPNNAPRVKHAAVRDYGASITFCEANLTARESTQARIIAETGATEIHPYDNARIICGQGTAAHELLADQAELDCLIAPVGGGGLLAGTALAALAHTKKVKVFGAEPVNADDAARSFSAGKIIPSLHPNTIADGLLTSLGERNFAIIQELVDGILTVSEQAIIDAMKIFWQRTKLIIEPSAATAVAALLNYPDLFKNKRVGVIISGGNVDLEQLPWQQN